MQNYTIFVFLLVSSLIAACGDDSKDQLAHDLQISPTPNQLKTMPVFDQTVVTKGRELYQVNCSKCHGKNAEGADNWRSPGIDGKYPPPPLNGSGHTWHHPQSILIDVIKEGSRSGGNMPGWKDKLSDDDIVSILTWAQSIWPEDNYKTWLEIDGRSAHLFHKEGN